jgi:hypothetical protein
MRIDHPPAYGEACRLAVRRTRVRAIATVSGSVNYGLLRVPTCCKKGNED